MAEGNSKPFFELDPERREEALRRDLAERPEIPPSEVSFQEPLESPPPEEVEQTPEERFKQSFIELSKILDKLVPFLPEKFKGRKTPPDFYLKHFPEGMTKEDYESALPLVEDTAEAARAGLEELEKSRGSLDEKEQQQKVVEIVKGVGGNVNSLLEDVKGKVSERKRLEEEAKYAKELGEERFEAGVGEKAKEAEERFEKFEKAPEKLEKLRKEIENRYRLIGHREGMIKWLDDATKPAWEEDLEKIKREVDDLFSGYLNRHIEYEQEKNKARGEEVELDRDSVSEKLVASFSDAYKEGYDYGVAQKEKFPLPEREVKLEKKALFEWARKKLMRPVAIALVAVATLPVAARMREYLQNLDWEKVDPEEIIKAPIRYIDELLGGQETVVTPTPEITPQGVATRRAAKEVVEPTPVSRTARRPEVKEEPTDTRPRLERSLEAVEEEDQFLKDYLGEDLKYYRRFRDYPASDLWKVLISNGTDTPDYFVEGKKDRERLQERVAIYTFAKALEPELREAQENGTLGTDAIGDLMSTRLAREHARER
ncbi:hypothetical protein E3J85_01580 [Patescibacteria group bacterium]|nr:MAG: hypothetical protein E3J85_01580 [Patescibacteria group bacterium]